MIITFVQFRLSAPLGETAATQVFEGSVPSDSDLPGLVHKHYVLSEDGWIAGGLCLWRERATAARADDANWHRRVRVLYGAEPQIAWFSSPVTVHTQKARP